MVSGINMQKKQPPAFIMSEFSKYGITPSGDKAADMEALKAAKEANGESTAQIEAFEAQMQQMVETKQGQGVEGQEGKQGPPTGAPPWSTLMNSLGIDPQGSKEEDMAAIYTKLVEMQSSAAGSSDQQSNIDSMMAQYELYNQM